MARLVDMLLQEPFRPQAAIPSTVAAVAAVVPLPLVVQEPAEHPSTAVTVVMAVPIQAAQVGQEPRQVAAVAARYRVAQAALVPMGK